MFANLKRLSGWTIFGLVWNGLFFLWSSALVVLAHDSFQILFMLLFAGLFLYAFSSAKKEVALAKAHEEAQAALEKVLQKTESKP